MNARILETIKKSAAVPSMPQVVLRFLEIMQDPEFDYKDLERILATDAGTVGEVLRLANSALFGVRNKVVSIKQALTLLGPKRTRSLLLGRYLVDTMSHRKVAGLDMSYFWRRSLASSVVASQFAGRLLPKHRDEVFISALLCDIGIPILAEALPKSYGPIAAQYTPHGEYVTEDRERAAVQVTHGEVSAMVLAHWTLPATITTAVNLHQSWTPGEGDAAFMARILNSADRIARLLCEVDAPDEIGRVCIDATAFIGVDAGFLVDLLPTIERDVEELADALRIDVIPSAVYGLVATAVQEAVTNAMAV